MFKVQIKKQNIVTNEATFKTQDEVRSWVADCEAQKAFGQPAWTEDVPPQIEITTEDGVQVQKEMPGYQIMHPAEYEITVEDITQETEQAKINKEALEFLAASDWYLIREMETGVKMPDEIRLERQKARESIVH